MRTRRVVLMLVGVPLLILTGCGTGGARPSKAPVAAATPAPAELPLALEVTPRDRAAGLPISTEVGTRVTGGSVAEVAVRDAAGQPVRGALRADGSSWVPIRPLKFGTRYTATVVATSRRGEKLSKTVTFTTMRAARNRVATGLYLFDRVTYGVAMPIAVEILQDVPVAMRADVQRRFFVSSDPPQPGAWHWFDGRQVQYRPASYWAPGTRLTVRIALDGHPLGGGRFGDADRRATVMITKDRVELKVTNSPKELRVFSNGSLIRTMKVSLGKASTPSSSGRMVIMDKAEKTVFDTFAELGPRDGYRVDIQYAQRLTWGGEFIHSAPWSVADQGVRNVSHGCVNVSPANASWLFALTHIGDPVTVSGTDRVLKPANGWTVWDMTWSDFIKGSAIPVSPDVASAPSRNDPEPGTSIAAPPSATVEPTPGTPNASAS